MNTLIALVWIPLLAVLSLLFPAAQEAPRTADSLSAPQTQMLFEMPPKDDPFYEDLPWVRPRERTVLPKVDFERLLREFKEAEQQDTTRFFRMLGDQLTENDFQLILLNYPRVALVYAEETGDFKGITDEGVFHLGFSYNIKQSLFYATKNPWMRVAGYNAFYDWLGDDFLGVFDFITRRVRFSYDGLDYQVQIWKGEYFFKTCTGSEIGFYTKPQSRQAQHYDCYPLDKMMPMSMKLYNERDIYFDLPPEEHWWPVMMAHRAPRVNPHQLSLESGIDFTKDPGLGEAFYSALEEQCPDFETRKDGDLVWFRWNATESVVSSEQGAAS